jgi:hypothetical protein
MSGSKRNAICKRGHSMTDPNNVVIRVDGGRRCKKCRDLKSRTMANEQGLFDKCKVCGVKYNVPTTWVYCSHICRSEDIERRKKIKAQKAADTEEVRTLTLLSMHDRLEKALTPWEKADIREEIRRYNARHDPSPRDADDGARSGANRH